MTKSFLQKKLAHKYKIILADPPWDYKNKVSNGAVANHYNTTDIYTLSRLPIETLAAENSVLFMWWTANFVDEAKLLTEAWGFKIRTWKAFNWIKLQKNSEQRINKFLLHNNISCYEDFMILLNREVRMNGGNYTRQNAEDVLIATKGSLLPRKSASVKQIIHAPMGRNSEKPFEVHARIEELYGNLSRIELFSRESRKGWHSWGDQSKNADIELINGCFYQTKS